MAARKTTHWDYDPKYDVESFDIDAIDKNNLVNHMLKLKQSDVTNSMITRLFGSFAGKTLCHHYDTFTVPAGAYKYNKAFDGSGKEVSNKNPFTTTFGIWIFNVFLIRDFGYGFLFGYINENLTKKKFKAINQTLIYAIMEDKIDTLTYTKYLDYKEFLMPFETILCPNQSEKVLTCTKILGKKKDELFKKYAEEIKTGNPAIAEQIEKELKDFAKEYLKDDPGMDCYLSGAAGSFDNNFKNMYIMNGAIRNPDPNAKQEYDIAKSSFIDGVSKDEYALIANSLVGGPYSRSKKTEIGGYWEKLIRDGFQTMIIDEPGTDCGTDKCIEVLLTDDNVKLHMYNWIKNNDGSYTELTMDNKDKFIGKKVKMRFTIFCKNKSCKICSKCAGNFMYRRGGHNIGLATIQLAAKLKLVSMKSFHDSTISTVKINPDKAFSYKG